MQERPAYATVADELRHQINSGSYPPGSRLPTIEELRRTYGVSEIVIRHAVALLRQEGLVETRRGGGTVVRTKPQVRRRAIERYAADARQAAAPQAGTPQAGSPDAQAPRASTGDVPAPGTSFTEDHGINWQDYQLATRYSRVQADEELAGLFGLAPGAALLRRHFVFYARGEPEQISVNYLPMDLVEGTPVADPAREPWPGGTIAQLAYLGRPVSRIEESVSSRMPTDSESRTLNVARAVPVFTILRRMISGGAVLEVCRHIVIPADRVVLEYAIDLTLPGKARDLADSCCRGAGPVSGRELVVTLDLLDVGVYWTVTFKPLPRGGLAHSDVLPSSGGFTRKGAGRDPAAPPRHEAFTGALCPKEQSPAHGPHRDVSSGSASLSSWCLRPWWQRC